jgi:esterase
MKLYVKQYSQSGAPLVILHGLYGNQGNWSTHARQLAAHYAVYAFDARNHGQSPHADSMRLVEMAADVAETMDSLGMSNAHVLGHSMGGKTAMLLALDAPERVRSLVVVDIAPVAYQKGTDLVLNALLSVDLAQLESRDEADAQLAEHITTKTVRDFLLTNLQRSRDGVFRWRINLPAISAYFEELTGWPEAQRVYEGPALFIRGEQSDYVLPEYYAAMSRQFPRGTLKTVANAGHWVHSEKPEAVQRLVGNFLAEVTGANDEDK